MNKTQIEELVEKGYLEKFQFERGKGHPYSYKISFIEIDDTVSHFGVTEKLVKYVTELLFEKLNSFPANIDQIEFSDELKNILNYKCIDNSEKLSELRKLHSETWNEIQNDIDHVGVDLGRDLDDYVMNFFSYYLFDDFGNNIENIFFPSKQTEGFMGEKYVEDWFNLLLQTEEIRDNAVYVISIQRNLCRLDLIKSKIAEIENTESNQSKSTDNSEEKAPSNTEQIKLNWLGTPAELGAIITALIDKGYLEGYQTNIALRRVLQQVFNITSDKGAQVASRTLDDYLGRNKKEYPINSFKLPFSDNYSKEKVIRGNPAETPRKD